MITDELQLRRTLTLAEGVIPVASPNLYFEIPQSACSIFTGRRSELDEVEKSLLTPTSSNQLRVQKRFVIYGLGGSGKTEICRKFAQENRHWYGNEAISVLLPPADLNPASTASFGSMPAPMNPLHNPSPGLGERQKSSRPPSLQPRVGWQA